MESKRKRLAGKLVSENSPFNNSSFFPWNFYLVSNFPIEFRNKFFLMEDLCFQWQG